MINGGQANNLALNGAIIDCTTRVCTQPPGICDGSIASTAFVCTAIVNAISGSNPAFCAAIGDCLAADPTIICPGVSLCINTTPGIINSTSAFGPGARASDTLWGVVRFATQNEVENGACNVALEPCDLLSVWGNYNPVQPFWIAFCAAIGSCGYAPLASPVFTGDPQAPSPAIGDNDTSIATTAFVVNSISASNPAFCAAVATCLSGGSPTCASVSALFPAAGGNPPAGTRFLGSDCLSYTAAQIVATGGGGGGGGGSTTGGGCSAPITSFTGPWRTAEQHAVWVGEDNSGGAGFAQYLLIRIWECNAGNNGTGAAVWNTIPNATAAQIRSGACPFVFSGADCTTGGGGGVQS